MVRRFHSLSFPPVQTIHMFRPSISAWVSGSEPAGDDVLIHILEVIVGRLHQIFRERVAPALASARVAVPGRGAFWHALRLSAQETVITIQRADAASQELLRRRQDNLIRQCPERTIRTPFSVPTEELVTRDAAQLRASSRAGRDQRHWRTGHEGDAERLCGHNRWRSTHVHRHLGLPCSRRPHGHPEKVANAHPPLYDSKSHYQSLLAEHVEKLSERQNLLYAHDRYAVLLIFQAMDAAGKDGVIKHVMSGVNPQGCQVFSFKHPSAEELDHDFLWRTTSCLPERGRIGIFNRSYYEEVLIVRVHPEILAVSAFPTSRARAASGNSATNRSSISNATCTATARAS